jgi:hypothetical protein
MKLAKSLLLGTTATLVVSAGAFAADLPSKKVAPINYVKVCDAYGEGFFFIPGTDTCIKLSGRARADFALSAKADAYATNVFAPADGNVISNYVYNKINTATVAATSNILVGTPYTLTGTASGYTAANGVSKQASNIYGWEARGRINIDSRNQTAYGSIQAVAALRMSRVTGVLDQQGPALSSSSAAPTLEAAFVRYAGFTFGAFRDNFSFMPSLFYGAGHYASFANGAKQIAYTAVLGGGFSATLAIQDAADTTAGGANALGTVSSTTGVLTAPGSNDLSTGANFGAPAYSYKSFPQVNARVSLVQSWGSADLLGAVGQAVAVNAGASYNETKTTYAIGAGLELHLPMIAANDILYLNAAWADGMTEYTTNWTSFKSSDTKRNVGGYVVNHPSWITTSNGIETLKSWDVAAIFTHFWSPMWRHSVLATYGAIEGTTTSKALAWSQTGAFGDAKVWNVGTQLTWLPAKDFEIGVDVLYARVEQDIRRIQGTNVVSGNNIYGSYSSIVTREKTGNVTGRLRVERTF